jgi:hypothetical protein
MKNINFSQLEVKPRHRLTKAERAEFVLSQDLQSILVGLYLGDLYVRKPGGGVNSRLEFYQGTNHEEYLLHLYKLFQSYCMAEPKTSIRSPSKQTGKVYSSIRFDTRALPCFNELYELFYVNGKKVIPSNIFDLLTPLGLAYWIGDDGSFCKTRSIVTLCTESFSLEEVKFLANTLNTKWDLKCYTNKTSNGGNRILIPRKSLPALQSLLKSIMPSMMVHKIGL